VGGTARADAAGAWTAWQFDPVIVAVAVAAAVAYLAGLIAARHRRRTWPVGRVVAFSG
jgi:cytochrome c oxidase assembly factor CtaG